MKNGAQALMPTVPTDRFTTGVVASSGLAAAAGGAAPGGAAAGGAGLADAGAGAGAPGPQPSASINSAPIIATRWVLPSILPSFPASVAPRRTRTTLPAAIPGAQSLPRRRAYSARPRPPMSIDVD